MQFIEASNHEAIARKELSMSLIHATLLLVLGFAIAAPASMVGLGGGILIVPTLILVFGLPAQNAVAVSLLAMCGTTFSASIGYMRQRRVDYKLSLLYDIMDIPGVALGAYLTTILPSNILAGLCGFFVMVISLLLISNRRRNRRAAESSTTSSEQNAGKAWERRKTDSSNQLFAYAIRYPSLALLSSFAGGLFTGLVGLGGGITDTTTMILVGVPPHIAVASSEFAMALTNGAGVITHGIIQNILWEYAIPLTIGTFIGAQIGVLAAKRVKGQTLISILSVTALILGIRLILLLFGV